jgi:hypothetical protein
MYLSLHPFGLNREVLVSGQSVQGNTFIGTSSSNQVDLLSLKQTLRRLTISDLNDLIDVLNVPSGQIPPSEADQASRVDKLLNWAKSPTGRGLERLQEVLEKITNPQ